MFSISIQVLQRRKPWRLRGFTLIELMIVVAVVAILAAIAYPSYQEQVRKGRRADAMAQMMTLAQAYERFYTSNNIYDGFWGPLPASQKQTPTQGTAFYQLTSTTDAGGRAFSITATPQVAGGQDQDRCGILTINQAGVKTALGTASIDECWR